METHHINYDGVDYKIVGDYEKPEPCTGFKGGFAWMHIYINDMEVSWHLSDPTIEMLANLVAEKYE